MTRHFDLVAALAVVATLVAGSTGCAGHVQIPPPPSDDDALVNYREQVRPERRAKEMTTTEWIAPATGAVVRRQTTTRHGLQLASGVLVMHPEDLIPVLEPGSPCAVSLREAADARLISDAMGGLGGALLGGAFVALVTAPERQLGLGPQLKHAPIPVPLSAAGAGALSAAAFGMMILGWPEVTARRHEAFECYEREFDVRDRGRWK